MDTSAITLPQCVFVIFLEDEDDSTQEYLGVNSLISTLNSNGYECQLIAGRPSETYEMALKVANLKPGFVGVSITAVEIMQSVVNFGHTLRAEFELTTHICAGGPVATFMGRKLLNLSDWYFLDSLVRGEGESVIVALVDAIIAKQNIIRLPGVILRNDPLLDNSIALSVTELDTLPWPSRRALEESNQSFASVLGGRGCTSSCNFCVAPNKGNNIAKNKVWRGRSPEDIVDELEMLVNKYQISSFLFIDSTFESPGGKAGKDRINRLATLILERGLRICYNIDTQAYSWNENDAYLLELLYQSGLEAAFIGIESGDDSTLMSMGKRSRLEDNQRAIRLFRQSGIYVHFGFIMFYPYSDWSHLENNAHFLINNWGYQLERFTSRLKLYPGAKIIDQLNADNLLSPHYFESLDPLAYKYANPMIGRFFDEINAALGTGCYKVPSVRKLKWWYDMDLHIFMSRIIRMFGNDPLIHEAVFECKSKISDIHSSLTNFNQSVWAILLKCGKFEQPIDPKIVDDIERHYSDALKHMRKHQLDLGINLGRLGKNVSRVRTTRTGRLSTIK